MRNLPTRGRARPGHPATRRAGAGDHRTGRILALVAVEPELDPLADVVAAAARRVGQLVIAGRTSGVGARLRADRVVAGGARLPAAVRQLQQDGHGVLVVSTSTPAALTAADCGIGVLTAGRRPPWGGAPAGRSRAG
ncbi:MAG: hypothetical protein ACXV3F_13915 [Frankiaceae bacterium]